MTSDGLPRIDQQMVGRVVRETKQGDILFRLGKGLTGVMHKSYLSWLRRRKRGTKRLKPGAQLAVVVKGISKSKTTGRQFIRLGHLYTQEEPWEQAREQHPGGSQAKCKVIEFYPGGAIVEFQSTFRALLRNDELSWTDQRKAPEVLRIGKEIKVVVYDHDHDKHRLLISRRRLTPDPWHNCPAGSVTKGWVIAVREAGATVKLVNRCNGFLPREQFPVGESDLSLGDSIPVIIVRCVPEHRRIELGWPPSDMPPVELPAPATPAVDASSTGLEVAPNAAALTEGAIHAVELNVHERNPVARSRCLAHYGSRCVICAFDFRAVYGPRAEGVIHVHHIKPLSEIGEAYEVDPIADLRPVCPNCHAVIHGGGGTLDIGEVKQMIAAASGVSH